MLCRSLPGLVGLVLVADIAGAHPPDFLTTLQGHAIGPYGDESFHPDSSLTLYGVIDSLGGNHPGVEYTFVASDLVESEGGLWDDFEHNCGGAYSYFTDGSLSVYEDATPDADPADLATYVDGDLVLSARTRDFVSLWVETGYPCYYIHSGCALEFTGGSWWEESASGWASTGGLAYTYDFLYPIGNAAEWFADITGTLWVDSHAPVRGTTWGRLKALYR